MNNLRKSVDYSTPSLTLPHQGGGNQRFCFFKVFLKRNTRRTPQAPKPLPDDITS
jgi:hypothetical protein